jgi:hypothetical protein
LVAALDFIVPGSASAAKDAQVQPVQFSTASLVPGFQLFKLPPDQTIKMARIGPATTAERNACADQT